MKKRYYYCLQFNYKSPSKSSKLRSFRFLREEVNAGVSRVRKRISDTKRVN